MFELTNKHLELISADVGKADISFSHLQYDLIDHICCDLENEMSHGLPFEKAYDVVKKRIGIRGLQQIQEDTLLLIDKKYRIMKNTMKIFGVIAPMLMTFGAMFKIEHWPGAGILLTLGFFLLCFLFLPSAVYVSYREVSNRKKLLTHLSGFLAGFLFAISFLFKIQHWPGAGIMMLTAAIISGLFFIPAFFINQLKECPKNQKIIYVFGLIGSLAYLAGFLFKLNHWPGATILTLSGALFLMLLAFPTFIVSHYKNYENVSSRFIFLTFALVWFVVPTSLIAINVSQDARRGFKENEIDKEYHIQFMVSKNNHLISKFEDGTSPESLKIKEIAVLVKKNSDELVDHIQSVKIKIFSLAKGEAINPDQPINVEDLNEDNGDACQQILFRQGEAKNLKEKIDVYRQFLAQNTGSYGSSSNLINDILTTSVPGKETPEFFKTWEQYNLKSFTLLTTIHKLTILQEKVRTAENIVLRNLGKKVASKQLLAGNQ